MTDWRPTSGVDAARCRAQMLQRTRNYFSNNDILEVDTPALSQYAASDTNIESFGVDSSLPGKQFFLNTSPEFSMKRLLAAGYPDIVSICKVFRDGEIGRRHQPEFTMIEWYRLGFELREIVADTLSLIATALDKPELPESVRYLNYAEIFKQQTDIDIFATTIDETTRNRQDF